MEHLPESFESEDTKNNTAEDSFQLDLPAAGRAAIDRIRGRGVPPSEDILRLAEGTQRALEGTRTAVHGFGFQSAGSEDGQPPEAP
jgi:hypothetical protein